VGATTRIAVLDDYQDVARDAADWSVLAGCELTTFSDHLADADAVVERLSHFDIVVAMRERTPFTRNVIERLPRLRLLVTTGPRNAAIDLEAAAGAGIVVSGTRGRPFSTAELTWGLIISLARQIPAEVAAVRGGNWQTGLGLDLEGATLGILGLARLGGHVSAIGNAFGMKVVAWSQNLTDDMARVRGAERVDKDELLATSDVVTIHLRLSDRTRGLIGAHELGLMKPTAFLVNTARGPIVDAQALLTAVQRGTIAGAGLDVFDDEPLPLDHALRQLPNVIVTPHIGYVTRDNYALFYGDAVEDIRAFLAGTPIRLVAAHQ
jgi:phosphoglycerate dehydrogenase-like enzyme